MRKEEWKAARVRELSTLEGRCGPENIMVEAVGLRMFRVPGGVRAMARGIYRLI